MNLKTFYDNVRPIFGGQHVRAHGRQLFQGCAHRERYGNLHWRLGLRS